MAIPYAPIVVNTGSKLVADRHRHRRGAFSAARARPASSTPISTAAGIDRKQIDAVVISHFHGDHVNGLLDADNKPRIPECRDPGAGARSGSS